MLRVYLDLGGLIPENRHRVTCVAVEPDNTHREDCNIHIALPGWAKKLNKEELELVALYLAARAIGDHSAWAAYHLKAVLLKKEVSRTLATKLLTEAKIDPEPIPVDMAEYWRGKVRALLVYENLKPILVKVVPPKDKKEREKLRSKLEGKRVTIRGKTYHVGGIIKKLGGRKIAPWLYLIPRNTISELGKYAKVKILSY